jgi:GNAT superfamily N-acetyltransferase
VVSVLPDTLTADEIRREALETPRRAYLPLPDLRVIERPGWMQIITPSFTAGGFNDVSHAVLTADTADAVIAETIATYRGAGLQFRWTVGPDSAPPDLGDRLARAGLVPAAAVAMARSTAPLESPAPAHDDPAIRIAVVDASNVDAFTATSADGWGFPDRAPFATANAAALSDPERHRLYLATVDGEPAATAACVMFPRSVYLIGGVTRERFRRRGLYHALVAARLADARARGIPLATSHARADTSAPILARLGFEPIAQLTNYRG